MRLILYVSIIIIVFICSPAFADWSQIFNTNYKEKGIDTAVAVALGEGVAPFQIMQQGLLIEGLPTPELIKALFCSLIQPTVIYESAEANLIEESTVEKGYQLALAQCAAEMEEQLNVAPGTPYSGVSPGGKGRPAQASPWNFN